MTDAMTAYYADLDERHQEAAAREQIAAEQLELKNRSDDFEALATDFYDTIIDEKRDPDLSHAIASIAAFFYAPGNPLSDDEDSGFYNDLRFQQKGMLGNMVQNANWMLENALRHRTELFTKMDEIEATFDHSEIAIRNLNRVCDQIERCQQSQIPACRDWFMMAEAAYRAILGEAWKPFAKRGASPKQHSEDGRKARIARLREG